MQRVRVADTRAWQEVCTAAFVPLKVRATARTFTADLRRVDLGGGASLAQVTSDASEVYRSDQLIRQTPAHAVLLSLHRSATGAVRQHGREALLTRGRAALYDASASYTLQFPRRMTEVVLQVPRDTFRHTGGRFAELLARPLPDTSSLRALTTLAGAIVRERAALEVVDRQGVHDALRALLLSATAVQGGPPPLPRELLRISLVQHIREHASEPDLDPARLAALHHVSLRLVQKCFEEDGTSAAATIREERLRIARRHLGRGAAVGAAARAAGFSNVDTFSRAYRRSFGESPRDFPWTIAAGGARC